MLILVLQRWRQIWLPLPGGSAGVGIATGIMTLLVLIFGEVVPKNLAAAHAETWAMMIAPFIHLVSLYFNTGCFPADKTV